MNSEFSGKIALVTGGNGAVGRYIVESLAQRGATVIVNSFHSYPEAKAYVASLCERGLDVDVIRGSVARLDQVERMFAEIQRRYPRLDILVNNAAKGVFLEIEEISEADVDLALATNVKGTLWCARAAHPLLARAGGGAIVNVSSAGAGQVIPGYVVTGVSKAALEALTRYLAVAYARDGIRVNTASADVMDNRAGRLFPNAEQLHTNVAEHTPLGRLATEQDLANLVVFLAGPDSGYVTGQCLLADGGLSIDYTPLSTKRRKAPAVPGNTEATATPGDDEPANDADPIVVVGMGIAVPGASTPDEFWRLLNDGPSMFTDPPADHWDGTAFTDPDRDAPDKSYQPKAGYITDFVAHKGSIAEGLDKSTIDSTLLWLRHCLHQALEDVGRHDDDRFTFSVGYTPDGSSSQEQALVFDELARGFDGDEVPQALRDRFRAVCDGERRTPWGVVTEAMSGLLPEQTRCRLVDTACSTSLYAIDLGVRDLMAGNCDVAVCGGTFAWTAADSVLFAKLGGLSPSGRVRAFDTDADGVLFADGAGLVVLKRLSRATADGDSVLGVLAGVGLSADGKGKAIYAPASAGQERAVKRALTKSAIPAAEVDYVVAHATGTPAGDVAEFASLRSCYGDSPLMIASNKSIIGHTGWAAGVVSVIQLLLALKNETVPAQHAFERYPESFESEKTSIGVVTVPTTWRSSPSAPPRTGAVSGFGFGGTNAHLIMREHRPGDPATPAGPSLSDDEVVLVGWAATVPGADDLEAVTRWAREGGEARSWEDRYPSPSFKDLRIPGKTVRHMDRTQLMLLECMRRLPSDVREVCERHNENTGVIVGHSGPTRSAMLYRMRAYLDDVEPLVAAASTDRAARLRTAVEAAIPAPIEDSFPGEMPNIAAARLANYHDLHGLSIVVDAGEASMAEALDVARLYLLSGELEFALVGAANGNVLPAWVATAIGDRAENTTAGEGAVLLAATTRSQAVQAKLPVLAVVDPVDVRPRPSGEQR